MKKLFQILFVFLLVLSGTSIFHRQVVAAESAGLTPPSPSKLTAVSGPHAGEVTLFWSEASYANRYAVAYGQSSGKYLYGADNIGGESARSYTVKGLTPGAKYYFVLAAARDQSSSPFSQEVVAFAGGGTVVKETPVSPVQPAPVEKVSTTTYIKENKLGLTASSGPKIGEVTLSWQHADSADNYHLVYGTSLNYQYGALNLGNTTKFTVSLLAPGKTYYFALVPLVGGRPLYTTTPVKAVAYQPVEIVVTVKEALIEPPPPPPVTNQLPSEEEQTLLDQNQNQEEATNFEEEAANLEEEANVKGMTDELDSPVETPDQNEQTLFQADQQQEEESLTPEEETGVQGAIDEVQPE